MKNKYFFLTICFICILFSSCSETGLIGPEGPTGPQGKTGDAGAVGAAGKDGSIMYSGTGAPAATLGINGDYYLDKSTGNLYGPKVTGVWGAPTLLRGINGTDGTNGVNGSVTLSGNGTPSLSTGIVGDYFLDKTNYLLYGPKTISSWGIPILLRGADGTQGPAGAAGKDGSIMYSGSGVPVATLGINGDYYLDKNTGNLYGPKIASGWGTPIVLRGTNGTTGSTGATGATGATGSAGANGSTGATGMVGATGANGTNGSVTHTGLGTPDLSIGVMGDYYLDRTGHLLYGPKNVDGWGVGILLQGAQGAQGPIGPAGADGSVIYAGDYFPSPSLGKIGDYYVMKYTTPTFLGPKTAAGWPLTGLDLKGNTGASGSSVLNGTGMPSNAIGADGDFYIDVATYMIYGPKSSGAWGSGTSLKGADGNSNVIALETADSNTFSWVGEWDNKALRRQGTLPNDTSTVFTIPATYHTAVQQGIVAVYMRKNNGDGSYSWQQLNYTDKSPGFTVNYVYHLRINATDAKLRILYGDPYTTHMSFPVNKVRIVIVPQSSTGVLSNINKNSPMLQTMQKFNLQDKDFKKLN
jgi:hypothetical protein